MFGRRLAIIFAGLIATSIHAFASASTGQTCEALFQGLDRYESDLRLPLLAGSKYFEWRIQSVVENAEAGRAPQNLDFTDFLHSLVGLKFRSEIENLRTSWSSSQFTTPTRGLVSGQFQFLVHAVLDGREAEVQSRKPIGRTTWNTEPGHAWVEAEIHKIKRRSQEKLRNPMNFSDQGGVSASIISDRNPTTFGNSGYILKPNFENVFGTFVGDMGGGLGRSDPAYRSLLNRLEYYGITTPSDLIEKTLPTARYNEVALAGISPAGTKLSVIALFVKVSRGQPTCSAERWVELQKLSRDFGLPIVKIEDPPSALPRSLY